MELAWLNKIKRMMDELPPQYLEPEFLNEQVPEWVKLVGQLFEEEKKLFGVIRWLENRIDLEGDAHTTLHGESHVMTKDCLPYYERKYLMENEIGLIASMLFLSISERLGLPESQFIFNGYDIYAFLNPDIQALRDEFEDSQAQEDDWLKDLPFDPDDIN